MIKVFKLIKSDWERYIALHKKFVFYLFPLIFLHNPGMMFSVMYRVEHYLVNNKNVVLKIIGFIFFLPYYFVTYYIFDIDIPPQVVIGRGLYVHNRGIIFTNNVVTGNDLTLIGPLTIGRKGIANEDRAPVLGNNVTIFSGARVIGNISVGDNVSVGANAVVVKDVPSNCVVGGVPARIIGKAKP